MFYLIYRSGMPPTDKSLLLIFSLVKTIPFFIVSVLSCDEAISAPSVRSPRWIFELLCEKGSQMRHLCCVFNNQ